MYTFAVLYLGEHLHVRRLVLLCNPFNALHVAFRNADAPSSCQIPLTFPELVLCGAEIALCCPTLLLGNCVRSTLTTLCKCLLQDVGYGSAMICPTIVT